MQVALNSSPTWYCLQIGHQQAALMAQGTKVGGAASTLWYTHAPAPHAPTVCQTTKLWKVDVTSDAAMSGAASNNMHRP